VTINDNLKKVGENVIRLHKVFEGVYDSLEAVNSEIDVQYSDLQQDLAKQEPKLTKKQRREQALKLIQEKYPHIITIFKEIDVSIEGIDFLIGERLEALEEVMGKLEDIEEMADDIERKKQELDL
jgi:hypothetical protein